MTDNGELPIYEEGLAELLKEATDRNKIIFTNCLKTTVKKSEIIIITIGTPESKNGETDERN